MIFKCDLPTFVISLILIIFRRRQMNKDLFIKIPLEMSSYFCVTFGPVSRASFKNRIFFSNQ